MRPSTPDGSTCRNRSLSPSNSKENTKLDATQVNGARLLPAEVAPPARPWGGLPGAGPAATQAPVPLPPSPPKLRNWTGSSGDSFSSLQEDHVPSAANGEC